MNDEDDDNDISCSLGEWEALLVKTEREILTALNALKEAAQHGKTKSPCFNTPADVNSFPLTACRERSEPFVTSTDEYWRGEEVARHLEFPILTPRKDSPCSG
jgi:hypothetical protein